MPSWHQAGAFRSAFGSSVELEKAEVLSVIRILLVLFSILVLFWFFIDWFDKSLWKRNETGAQKYNLKSTQ